MKKVGLSLLIGYSCESAGTDTQSNFGTWVGGQFVSHSWVYNGVALNFNGAESGGWKKRQYGQILFEYQYRCH